jgi:hypothetical protein
MILFFLIFLQKKSKKTKSSLSSPSFGAQMLRFLTVFIYIQLLMGKNSSFSINSRDLLSENTKWKLKKYNESLIFAA